MTILGIRTAFKTKIDAISLGGNLYHSEQPTFNETNPVAIMPQLIDWTPRNGLGTIGSPMQTQTWELMWLMGLSGASVGKTGSGPVENLETHLTDSNLASIEATDFTTHADGCVVTGVRDFGEYRISGKRYVGCVMEVSVWGVSA
jgi:hypothetical protein